MKKEGKVEAIKLLSDCLFSHQGIDFDKSTERSFQVRQISYDNVWG